MTAYYNENDPKAAAWLRELIKQNLIAPGDVDERSIEDVRPNDLKEYTQCHFFAGIGVWSYALRQAGWSDDKPIWTGSCPCQPFSSAGKGQGFDDQRHLWPAFHWLIRQCRPVTIIGEQVASKAGIAWLDIISADLEKEKYARGSIVFPACSVGAPHQRQRLYWVANDLCDAKGPSHRTGNQRQSINQQNNGDGVRDDDRNGSCACGMANSVGDGQHRQESGPTIKERPSPRSKVTGQLPDGSERRGSIIELANNNSNRCDQKRKCVTETGGDGIVRNSTISNPAATNGFWSDVDWLYCRDGKWRPVEPGTFPLAHGFAERVGLLRGFGNAIVAEQAKIFIEACQEILI